MSISERLFALQDTKYREFNSKLIPTVSKDKMIGVRVPQARKLAKELIKNSEYENFLEQLPHEYYDENVLHALLISEIKDYKECIEEIEKFLPYIDNWAVCDILSPKIFKKNRAKLIKNIKIWSKAKEEYTCRFGLGMLMAHYLEDDFQEEYLNIPADIHRDEYYVNMMIAWFFATALAKKWESTITYLENQRLDVWVHNKTIQKACESSRITKEQKEYVRSLKR